MRMIGKVLCAIWSAFNKFLDVILLVDIAPRQTHIEEEDETIGSTVHLKGFLSEKLFLQMSPAEQAEKIREARFRRSRDQDDPSTW